MSVRQQWIIEKSTSILQLIRNNTTYIEKERGGAVVGLKAIIHYPKADETKKLLIDLAEFRSNMVAQHIRLMELSDSARQILSQEVKYEALQYKYNKEAG